MNPQVQELNKLHAPEARAKLHQCTSNCSNPVRKRKIVREPEKKEYSVGRKEIAMTADFSSEATQARISRVNPHLYLKQKYLP